jgi:hypothetical protein
MLTKPQKLTRTSTALSANEPSSSPMRPLSKAGRTLWDAVFKDYDIADAGGKELLLQACEALDQAAKMRDVAAGFSR